MTVPARLAKAVERGGLAGVELRGDAVALTVFPDAGGKVLDLVDVPSGVDLLWKNPRVPLARTYAGAPFDDVWCGGWDELFPTDAPCTFDGNAFHDHGDLWIGPWECEVAEDDGERATLALRRASPSLPCVAEKRITVERRSRTVVFAHRLTNVGPRRIRFLWNLHVAHAIEATSRLHLRARSLAAEPPYTGRAGGGVVDCAWPTHTDRDGVRHDLSRVPPPESGASEFLWGRVDEGWCAVTHADAGVGLALAWDTDVFPTLWLFADYGGWRGHYVLLTELATGPPGSLASAVADGTAAGLEPGASLETTVLATVLDTVDRSAAADARPPGLRSLAKVSK